MQKRKEDALFRKIAFEAAKVKSADLERQAIELNKEPIPGDARARFMRELDKMYPESTTKRRAKMPIRIPRRGIAIAAACIVLTVFLIPATSEAGRRRISELIKKVMPHYTEYQLDQEILGFDGKYYVPIYIPDGFMQFQSESITSMHIASYYEKRDHTISFEKVAQKLAQNEDFRDAPSAGGYAYVDNCFVLREKKYIYRDVVGLLCLTQYAKAHIAGCCLTFAIRHKKSRDAIRYATV